MKPFLICALIGIAISAAGWFAPPGYVTSNASLSARGLESPTQANELEQRMAAATLGLRSRESLTPVIHSFGLYPGVPLDEAVEKMRRDMTIQRTLLGPSQVVEIAFRYRDRLQAQRAANWLAQQLNRNDRDLRFIDPASLPTDHTEPYRQASLVLGLPVGFITGVILGWRRRRAISRAEILPAT